MLPPKYHLRILSGVLSLLAVTQAQTGASATGTGSGTGTGTAVAQPQPSVAKPPDVPPLFGANGTVYTDAIQKASSVDDPQAWFPASAAIVGNINSTRMQGLFDNLSTTGDRTIVKLHLLDGGETYYNVSYNEAYKNGTDVMGNPRAGWPAVLRSAIIQHNLPGVETYRLGQGLAKDCMKALTGESYRADQVETVDLWSIWETFTPDKYPFIFRTNEGCTSNLTAEHDYGVLQVYKAQRIIELYDPNPEVGRRAYYWDEIISDLDIVSWPIGLTK